MRKISQRVKAILLNEPEVCARKQDGGCKGRITYEHSLIYAGRQIDEAWAIIKLCAYHHAVDEYQDCGDLQKEKNVWIALNRATDDELRQYSKAINYIELRTKLNEKYLLQNNHQGGTDRSKQVHQCGKKTSLRGSENEKGKYGNSNVADKRTRSDKALSSTHTHGMVH